MDTSSNEESALFADLTRIFMAMKDAPYRDVEAAVEERFRAFMGSGGGRNARGLQITLAWTMTDGADSWAVQGMRYDTLSDDEVAKHWCR